MVHSNHSGEVLHLPAPPVPPRNPLRNDPHYQACKPLHTQSKDAYKAIISPPNPLAFLDNVQPRLTSIPHVRGRHKPGTWTNDITGPIMPKLTKAKAKTEFPQSGDGASTLNDEDKTFLSSTRSSVVKALKRCSTYLDPVEITDMQSNGGNAKTQRKIEDAMTRMRKSTDGLESLITISSYDGALRTENTAEWQDEDTKVEEWLQRGIVHTISPESDNTSLSPEVPQCSLTSRRHAFTIFPPTSPQTGRREYAPPHSPLNNGRDAYGNHISTNAKDRFTEQCTPSSRKVVCETDDLRGQNQIPAPHLRGGGGWWNTLGIGPAEEQPGNNPHRTPVQSAKGKSHAGLLDPLPLGPGLYSESLHIGSAPTRGGVRMKDKSLVAVEDDWLDESDNEILDKKQDSHSKELARYAAGQFGSVQYRRQENSVVSSPVSPLRRFTRTRATHKQSVYPSREDEEISYTSSVPDTHNELDPVLRRLFDSQKGAETSMSDFSHGLRLRKRWNQLPNAGPPTLPVIPPPPPPEYTKPLSKIASSVGGLPYFKNKYEYPQSPAESYEDYIRDIQSLQLGESVSAVDYGSAYNFQAAERQKVVHLSPEEFEAAQRAAQVEFRPLCQDIMIRYNAEISRVRRAHQLNQISPEQFRVQIDWNIQNKNKALQHSAELSNYVILTDEFSILEALYTVDGYAIYHAMLNTTNPELWKELVEQHRMAPNMPTPIPKSSLDQTRTIVGKITRFILAVPSDPELKTRSTRKPLEAVLDNANIPLAWMDPMAAATFAGSTTNEAWRTRRKKDKGRVKAPVASEGISTQDFAPLGTAQSRLTDTTAIDSNSHWTTTTAVPPARPAGPISQPHRLYSNDSVNDAQKYHSGDVTAASEVSMWPENDSQGNWYDAKRPRELASRGGSGTKKHGEAKSVWRDILPVEMR